MMFETGKLLYPTYFSEHASPVSIDDAIKVANRVLSENKMGDFEVTYAKVSIWKGYYFCPYHNIEDATLRQGGDAVLIVRAKDGLGGMVHCLSDWLEQDIGVINAPIEDAYRNFDLEGK